jgi:hypothetical protein
MRNMCFSHTRREISNGVALFALDESFPSLVYGVVRFAERPSKFALASTLFLRVKERG